MKKSGSTPTPAPHLPGRIGVRPSVRKRCAHLLSTSQPDSFAYAGRMSLPDRPVMHFLDEFGAISKTRNKLPHWQQGYCACFVTFRLNDSIPADVLTRWNLERKEWIGTHHKPWDLETEQAYHRRFSRFIDRQLDDCRGQCLLRDPQNSDVVDQSLKHFDRERYLLHCHVVMPNHLHVLVSVCPEVGLASVVSTWKRWTATRIGRGIDRTGGIWQRDYFDRLIRDWDHFINVARYIRNNPRKAGLPDGAYRLYEAPWIERLLG
jgi:putative transposase